jgi:hypothetical protein
VIRDALVAVSTEQGRAGGQAWSLPVVSETWDRLLNDIDGFHVRAEHLRAALDELPHRPFIMEFDLPFGWMNVYVHRRRIDFEKKATNRVASFHEGSVIAL